VKYRNGDFEQKGPLFQGSCGRELRWRAAS
jgi:hypothetical protein